MNIGLYLVVFAGAAVGLLSSLYIVVSLVWTIAYKIYRKIKFGVSIYNQYRINVISMS